MRFFPRRNRGFIKTILLIIVALVLLKYFFNITLGDIMNSQIVKDIWEIVKSLFLALWNVVLMIVDLLKSILTSIKNSLAK